MVDIVEVSAIVAAAGVLVGVVWYILDMRNQTRLRQIDLVMRLYSIYATEEFQKEMFTLMTDTEVKDYNTFKRKYGVNVPPTGLFFHAVGVLLSKKLADIHIIRNLFGTLIIGFWERGLPWVEDARRQLNAPGFGGGFEYLVKELKKEQQQAYRTA